MWGTISQLVPGSALSGLQALGQGGPSLPTGSHEAGHMAQAVPGIGGGGLGQSLMSMGMLGLGSANQTPTQPQQPPVHVGPTNRPPIDPFPSPGGLRNRPNDQILLLQALMRGLGPNAF